MWEPMEVGTGTHMFWKQGGQNLERIGKMTEQKRSDYFILFMAVKKMENLESPV